MSRIVWLTDIHLNFLEAGDIAEFCQRVRLERPDAVLLGGDIAEAPRLRRYLESLDDQLQLPLYFVLGNHDYYRGSIEDVRIDMQVVCQRRPRLRYLTRDGVIELTQRVGLIGHDGWADGRAGDYEHSDVMLNDYLLIQELAGATPRERRPLLEALGDEAADHLRRVLPLALAKYEQDLLLTHVPPLHEACWHQGRLSDDNWAPHFACLAVGDAILEAMKKYPERQLTVLCGHTHSPGECRPLPNVTILTGEAQYGFPIVQRVFEVD